jgi:hypothetical protein
MVLFSFCNYYYVFFPTPQPDSGWAFLMLPFLQLLLGGIISTILYLFGKIVALIGRHYAK